MVNYKVAFKNLFRIFEKKKKVLFSNPVSKKKSWDAVWYEC